MIKLRRPLAAAGFLLLLILFVVGGVLPPQTSKHREWTDRYVCVSGTVLDRQYKLVGENRVLVLTLENSTVYSDPDHGSDRSMDHSKVFESIPLLPEGSGVSKYESSFDSFFTKKKLICTMEKEVEQIPRAGDHVLLAGKLSFYNCARNPGGFDAETYYRMMGVEAALKKAKLLKVDSTGGTWKEHLLDFRDRLDETSNRIFYPEDRGIMKTMLLGERQELEKETKDLFGRNGISHILAISGLHISLLGMGVYRSMRKAGTWGWMAAGVSSLLILGYGLMVGMTPSAARAVCMFLLSMGAVICKRTYDLPTALVIAGLIIAIPNPEILHYSGFLYSFGAVASLAYLTPFLEKTVLPKRKWSKTAAGMLGLWLGTFPVQLWFQYEYSWISPFLNLLIIPFMSLLVGLGICGVLIGTMWVPAGKLCGVILHPILTGIRLLASGGDRIGNLRTIVGRPTGWMMVLFFLFLTGLILLQNRCSAVLVIWGLALMARLLTGSARGGPEITVIDVGQGDGIYLSDGRHHYLVDGGSSDRSRMAQYDLIPFLKYKGAGELDAVYLSHMDVDHCNGVIDLLDAADECGIRIRRIVVSEHTASGCEEQWEQIREKAKIQRIPIHTLSEGMEITQGMWTFRCLYPKNQGITGGENENSMVLCATCKDRCGILLTGDLEGEGEQYLTGRLQNEDAWGEIKMLPIRILKVAHHGSRGSTSADLLESYDPSLALISAGEGNSYGHPHKELLERLSAREIPAFCTTDSGALTVHIGRHGIRLEKYLK